MRPLEDDARTRRTLEVCCRLQGRVCAVGDPPFAVLVEENDLIGASRSNDRAPSVARNHRYIVLSGGLAVWQPTLRVGCRNGARRGYKKERKVLFIRCPSYSARQGVRVGGQPSANPSFRRARGSSGACPCPLGLASVRSSISPRSTARAIASSHDVALPFAQRLTRYRPRRCPRRACSPTIADHPRRHVLDATGCSTARVATTARPACRLDAARSTFAASASTIACTVCRTARLVSPTMPARRQSSESTFSRPSRIASRPATLRRSNIA